MTAVAFAPFGAPAAGDMFFVAAEDSAASRRDAKLIAAAFIAP